MTTTTETETRTICHAHVGRGGWSLDLAPDSPSWSRSTRSGYGGRAELIAELRGERHGRRYTWAPDALLIDTTTISDDEIVRYGVRGPMTDPTLPAGTFRPLSLPSDDLRGGIAATIAANYLGTVGLQAVLQAADVPPGVAPWPTVALDVDPFGGAGSLDDVAADVAGIIARRFGAQVETIDEATA